MRKVWLILFTITMLVVAMALPAMAATPGTCNNKLWSGVNSPAITQPTTCLTPNCPVTNEKKDNPNNCSKLNLSSIIEQVKKFFGQDCPTADNCGSNCPSQVNCK